MQKNENRDQCLICSSSRLNFSFSYYSEYDRQKFDIFTCQDCGSLICLPIYTKEELLKLYPEDYLFKRIRRGNLLLRMYNYVEWLLIYRPTITKRIKLLNKFKKDGRIKILDIGCGSGLFLEEAKREGFDIQGVDFSKDALEAKKRLKDDVFIGDFLEVDFSENSYDIITLFYVFEHLLSPREIFKKINKILKKEGIVIFSTPIIDGFGAKVFKEKWVGINEMPRHTFIPSYKSILDFLNDTGFTLIHVENAPFIDRIFEVCLSLFPFIKCYITYRENIVRAVLLRSIFGFTSIIITPFFLLWERLFKYKPSGYIFIAKKI